MWRVAAWRTSTSPYIIRRGRWPPSRYQIIVDVIVGLEQDLPDFMDQVDTWQTSGQICGVGLYVCDKLTS